jgi:TRAP-type C4-dicarboxylate transport system permease small subunit
MSAFARRLWTALDLLVLTAFVVMLVLVSAQVCFRYILQISVPWTEEAARWFYAWQIFLGSAVAMKRGLHLRATFVVDRLPARLRAGVDLVAALAGMVFLAGIGWGSLLMMQAVYPVEAGSFSVSTSYLYLSIPVSLTIMLWLAGAELLRAGHALLWGRGRD